MFDENRPAPVRYFPTKNGRTVFRTSILLFFHQKINLREEKDMGDLIVILGLALYVPMSIIFVLRGKE